MKRILNIIGFVFGLALIWFCGFMTGRITAPVVKPKVIYVKRGKESARMEKQQRQIFTSKRGKKYYLTPAGNRVYVQSK